MTRPVLLPRSLEEALAALAEAPQARVYHGGTDLLVQLRRGMIDPPVLICLERVGELTVLEENDEDLFIGAGVSHARLLDDPATVRYMPLLIQSLYQLGSPPIRRAGTLGGNIATASPAGDALPPLYCLDASLRLISEHGQREVPLAEFILGPGRTILAPGELILGVRVPKPPLGEVHHFEKVGRRKALAIAVASLAARIRLNGDGLVESARLAWGSVAPTVFTCPQAEARLTGRALDMDALGQAASIVRDQVRPIGDVRASAEYRRRAAGNLLFRLAGLGRSG